jgi:hypothetical protein
VNNGDNRNIYITGMLWSYPADGRKKLAIRHVGGLGSG